MGLAERDLYQHKSVNHHKSFTSRSSTSRACQSFSEKQNPNWLLHIISVPLPHIAAQVPCLPSGSIQRLPVSCLTLRWCMQDAAHHCHNAAYPLSVWHVWQTPSAINSCYQWACYLLEHLEGAEGSAENLSEVSGARGRIVFLLFSINGIHEY